MCRRLSKGVRPPGLDDRGLVAAVRRLATDLESRRGIKVRLRVNGPNARLESNTELGCFRIAQEALNNVERHSQATSVEITLSCTSRLLKLTIRDNGRGFESDAGWTEAGSLGLLGMQERAALLGGELEIESQPGQGTLVGLSLPVNGPRR